MPIDEESIRKYQEKHFGKRYIGASLCKMQIPEWVSHKIVTYMNNPKNMLVFTGAPGLGKTYFCAAITEWIMNNFETYRYYKEEHILRNLRNGISDGKGDYLIALELLIDDDIIILDDIASGINPEKSSYRDLEFRREVFFSFLDYRYNSMKPTIITSNLSKQQFEDVYSDRIASRLFASENAIIEVFGEGLDKREQGM